MRCIIVEDELPAQEILLGFIEKTSFLSCIGVYENPTKIPLEILNQCDLVFMDIEMPDITGLEYLKSTDIKSNVIICTAYRDYAIDAFEENVTDYLLKPFSYARFLKSVMRVKTSFMHSEDKGEVFVYADKTFHKIILADIYFIKAEVDYIKISFNNDSLLVQDSLNNWEEKYKQSNLIRIHRSYIINFKQIEKIQGNQLLINGLFLPIGKTYRESFFAKIKS